jgi:hypothetical protein
MTTTLPQPQVDRTRITAHLLDASNWRFMEHFHPEEYSKFKYGCARMSRKFGEDLAEKFIASDFFQNYNGPGDDLVVTSSPYKFIESASTSIMNYFLNRLNTELVAQGKNAAGVVKINRCVLFEGDYGKLTEEARSAQSKRDKMSIDAEFVRGKTLLVIDDVKITGAHEQKVADMLIGSKVEVREALYLYYAELEDAHTTGADYEDFLNHYYVKSIKDLSTIIEDAKIRGERFLLNARVCKYILSHPVTPAYKSFLFDLSMDFYYDLLSAIHGDGYQKMELYRENYEEILAMKARLHSLGYK